MVGLGLSDGLNNSHCEELRPLKKDTGRFRPMVQRPVAVVTIKAFNL